MYLGDASDIVCLGGEMMVCPKRRICKDALCTYTCTLYGAEPEGQRSWSEMKYQLLRVSVIWILPSIKLKLTWSEMFL